MSEIKILTAMFFLVFTAGFPGPGYAQGLDTHRGTNGWGPILDQLNAYPIPLKGKAGGDFQKFVGLGLTADFQNQYREEMRVLKSTWNDHARKKGWKPVGSARRRERNAFYFEQAALKNKSVDKQIWQDDPKASSRLHWTGKEATFITAAKALEQVAKNPVTSLEALKTFAHSNQIGFCFGRAMFVHHLLLQAKVERARIMKMFVLGEMRVASQLWQFHVAVLVAPKPGEPAMPLVIDPLVQKPFPYDSWRDEVLRHAVKYPTPRLRFYPADARKFLPSSGEYSGEMLSSEHLRSYFEKLRSQMVSR